MMLNLNIRDIKIENKKNNSHTKHGRDPSGSQWYRFRYAKEMVDLKYT